MEQPPTAQPTPTFRGKRLNQGNDPSNDNDDATNSEWGGLSDLDTDLDRCTPADFAMSLMRDGVATPTSHGSYLGAFPPSDLSSASPQVERHSPTLLGSPSPSRREASFLSASRSGPGIASPPPAVAAPAPKRLSPRRSYRHEPYNVAIIPMEYRGFVSGDEEPYDTAFTAGEEHAAYPHLFGGDEGEDESFWNEPSAVSAALQLEEDVYAFHPSASAAPTARKGAPYPSSATSAAAAMAAAATAYYYQQQQQQQLQHFLLAAQQQLQHSPAPIAEDLIDEHPPVVDAAVQEDKRGASHRPSPGPSVMCCYFKRFGRCKMGDACWYSHHGSESTPCHYGGLCKAGHRDLVKQHHGGAAAERSTSRPSKAQPSARPAASINHPATANSTLAMAASLSAAAVAMLAASNAVVPPTPAPSAPLPPSAAALPPRPSAPMEDSPLPCAYCGAVGGLRTQHYPVYQGREILQGTRAHCATCLRTYAL